MPTLATNASYIIEWLRLNNVLFSPTLPIFLPALPFLGRRRLLFVAEMHPNSRALRNRVAKVSRTRITVRRFERPLRSASIKHPIMRTLLDLCLLLFLRRTEKTAQALRKSRGLLLKSRQLSAHSSQLFQVASPPSSLSRPKRWN